MIHDISEAFVSLTWSDHLTRRTNTVYGIDRIVAGREFIGSILAYHPILPSSRVKLINSYSLDSLQDWALFRQRTSRKNKNKTKQLRVDGNPLRPGTW